MRLLLLLLLLLLLPCASASTAALLLLLQSLERCKTRDISIVECQRCGASNRLATLKIQQQVLNGWRGDRISCYIGSAALFRRAKSDVYIISVSASVCRLMQPLRQLTVRISCRSVICCSHARLLEWFMSCIRINDLHFRSASLRAH